MIQRKPLDFSKYIGIPYRTPDKDKDGLHCWELVEKVMHEVFEMQPPVISFSGKKESIEPMFMTHLQNWKTVDAIDVKVGDMVMLRIAGYPMHCGIMIGDNLMLHTLKGRNSCVENLNSVQWNKRVLGFYRWNDNDTSKQS